VAALTHDIVWLEEAEVNGEKVLVPVLYLAQAKNRLAPNGALIQGRRQPDQRRQADQPGHPARQRQPLRHRGEHRQQRPGRGSQRLQLLGQRQHPQCPGRIIAGRDVSLTALTGDVINERSVTRIDSAQGQRTWTASFADSAARIEAAGNLTSPPDATSATSAASSRWPTCA
jgi:filamentous hemagglutinin